MNRALNIRFHFYLTALLAFLLPIYPRLIPPAIALLFINWLAGGNFKNLLDKNKNHTYFFLSISLYSLYAIALIYSSNMEYGLKDLEIKLSLLVFPIIYFSSKKINHRKLQSIFKAFIYGCITAALICFGYSLYQYFHTKYLLANNIWAYNYEINFFLKDRLSVWMHPSYRSMYCMLALAAIYFLPLKEPASLWEKYFIPVILSVFIFLLNSKAGIISLFLFGIYLAWQLVAKRKFRLVAVGTTVSLVLFTTLYFTASEFALRVKSVFNVFSENVDVTKSEESTASRMAVWNAAATVIAENFIFGTGSGDIKDALFRQYKKEKMLFALQYNLNAHSQFLQTFAALGIIGFFSLCASLLIPFFREWKKRNYIYLVFILIIILNLMAESMFETQAGVVFYAFFNSLLLFSQEKKYDSLFPSQNHR